MKRSGLWRNRAISVGESLDPNSGFYYNRG